MKNIKVSSDQGEFEYKVCRDGKEDVAKQLQAIFDELKEKGVESLSIKFGPGVYYINQPLVLNFVSIRMEGEAHGGVDIHGMNLKSGTILNFGKDCYPNCITLNPSGADCDFPGGRSPWEYKTVRASFAHLNFMGYNNTDVDTHNGYSRFRGDEPNFRGLKWYPAEGRYENVERDGQRAIVIPKSLPGEKPEMLSIESCYFTELYVGIEVKNSDVSTITNSWFGQMVYGIRYENCGQCIAMSNNCFADLETAVTLKNPTMSTLHNNTIAYVSKCFVIDGGSEINISSNAVKNWAAATGTAPCGGFLQLTNSINVNINGNTVHHGLDSRVKTITIDQESNGKKFIDIDHCENVLITGNIFDTRQTEEVIGINESKKVIEVNNLINIG